MNKENIEKLLSSVQPIITMVAESNIQVKTLTKHYIKTICELTNKTEKEVLKELTEIHNEIKKNELDKLEKNNGMD
ncbi:hypothetical protein [uncultured Psychroserpens sp.]|uniref:hypothetical protein n=1 Tax=uncultured Psychroserpens sp. TaxID=255436 RepID=UPI00260B8B13|nr:hypothetical protein [uncultured Psychroserpens sp.]